nr:NADH dehydrogenase subunit 1 [Hoplopleura pacifica]
MSMIAFFILSVMTTMGAVMVGVAYLSLFERKLMGLAQYRQGPSKVSTLYGMFQPFSDAVKLASKQNPTPSAGEIAAYILAPIVMCSIYLASWCIPTSSVCPFNMGYLTLLALFSCGTLWQAASGWVAHSSYSEMGSIRSIAQSISFEIILSMGVLTFVFSSWWSASNYGRFNCDWMWLGPLLNPPIFSLFLLALMAESGRSPFDLPEGESELVAGYTVDYGGSMYKLIFMAENLSCLLVSGLITSCCFHSPSLIIHMCVLLLVIFIRISTPRAGFRSLMPVIWVFAVPSAISSMSLGISMA